MSSALQFLGEEDFLPAMEKENRLWREQHVTQGDMESFDGVKLRYYRAEAENPKGSIVMVHGFCEFFGKYHELAWYFWQAGFSVYFLEQRGHGYSEGKLKEPDIVHIDSYRTYVEDLRTFTERIVKPETEGIGRILFAHSMGGAVGTMFLESYPDFFHAAVLSSPMLKMSAGEYSSPLLVLVRAGVKLLRKEKTIAPGQNRFDGVNVFATSSTLSKPRYDYLFAQRLRDIHYQTYGASFGWALASMEATRRLRRDAGKIKIPVTLFTAGNDHLVDPEGYLEFEKNVPQVKVFSYPTSKHEIFNADEPVRRQYLSDLFATLDQYASELLRDMLTSI